MGEQVHDWLAETRVTNPKTGGEKGSKPAQLGAVDPASLLELASVAGMGSDKYARYNFAKGVDWSLFFDAMMRHSLAFWGGEDLDPESGLPHMAHAAWHACALLTMMRRHPDLDDRFPSPTARCAHMSMWGRCERDGGHTGTHEGHTDQSSPWYDR